MLQVMFTESSINCQEPHNGLITDILFIQMNGQNIVFTTCVDSKIRVFGIKPDNSGFEKMLEHSIPNSFGTKLFKSGEAQVICALDNGKFLAWNLTAN